MRADFAYHTGIGDIAFALSWDVPILDWLEGVGAFNAFLALILWMVANALA